MSDSERDKKLDQLLELMRKAPVMNGGFDRLSAAVENIKETNSKVLYELQLVKTTQDVHTKKFEDIHKSLYDPDDGLYQRVSMAITDNITQEKNIARTEVKLEKVVLDQDNTNEKMNRIEKNQEILENIAGKDFQELRETISTRKNMMRTFWVFATGAVAGFAKFLWDIIPGIF